MEDNFRLNRQFSELIFQSICVNFGTRSWSKKMSIIPGGKCAENKINIFDTRLKLKYVKFPPAAVLGHQAIPIYEQLSSIFKKPV